MVWIICHKKRARIVLRAKVSQTFLPCFISFCASFLSLAWVWTSCFWFNCQILMDEVIQRIAKVFTFDLGIGINAFTKSEFYLDFTLITYAIVSDIVGKQGLHSGNCKSIVGNCIPEDAKQRYLQVRVHPPPLRATSWASISKHSQHTLMLCFSNKSLEDMLVTPKSGCYSLKNI